MSLEYSEGTASRTSPSLLQAAKENDREAWRRIVDTYSRRIYRWCRQSGLAPDDSSDVVQEVFRAVARKLIDFHHTDRADSFRGWLRTITRNKLRDYHSHRPGRNELAMGGSGAQRLMSEIPELVDDESTGGNRLSTPRRIDQTILQQIQTEFSDRDWQVFWRVVVDGQTTADAGLDYRMTSNAVRLVKMRILRRFREIMNDPRA